MSHAAPSAFDQFLLKYGPPAGEAGPVLFVKEVLGATPEPWQEEALRAYGRRERRIAIRSGHGVGKTTFLAWLVIYQLICKFPQKTVATAPSSGQLETALIPEVKKWIHRLPELLQERLDVKSTSIQLKARPAESFFEARTSRAENPEALQGVHSDDVLLLGDEGSGIAEPVYESAGGSLSTKNAILVLAGNPLRTSGTFFEAFHKLSDLFYTIHVPYTASSRTDMDYVEGIRRQYGEDSNAFRVRCLGEFPRGDDDTIIPFEYVESARHRDIDMPAHLDTIWGIDVARFGSDSTVLVRRNNIGVLPEINVWHGQDLMELTGRIKIVWDDTPYKERPSQILVDVIGLGAGVVDRLRELGLPVRGINVAESSSFKERYSNLRTELWFKAREWLASRDHTLPICDKKHGCPQNCPHEKLAQELVAPRFKPLSGGKYKAEPKGETKKRLLRSPDIADAFILTLATEASAATHGRKNSFSLGMNWNAPVRRKVSVL